MKPKTKFRSGLEKLEKALEDQEKACEEAWEAWDAAEAEWSVRWDAVYTCRQHHYLSKQ